MFESNQVNVRLNKTEFGRLLYLCSELKLSKSEVIRLGLEALGVLRSEVSNGVLPEKQSKGYVKSVSEMYKRASKDLDIFDKLLRDLEDIKQKNENIKDRIRKIHWEMNQHTLNLDWGVAYAGNWKLANSDRIYRNSSCFG